MKIYKAHAKVNIFLKITGTRGIYHTLASRFVRLEHLYDSLEFKQKANQDEAFVILGDFNCTTEQNTIYKAYKALLKATKERKLQEFFSSYSIAVTKRIPSFAGLGGGSSDAATFLKMCNDELALGLSIQQLAEIGAEVGADVPFFVYGYQSANVFGIGEIVEEFYDDPIELQTITPKIEISTPAVYKKYRASFFDPIDQSKLTPLLERKSIDILKEYDRETLNDLYAPAKALYPELQKYETPDNFFSGSGSSFFSLV